jgi:hypothetical protein
MNKQVQQKVDSLMNTAKLFTDTYNKQVMLATTIALQCLNESYKSSSLESSRIEFWEDVMDELKAVQKEIE